ncbi:MAG: cache domain-containing protein, partial [Clostridium sp.]
MNLFNLKSIKSKLIIGIIGAIFLLSLLLTAVSINLSTKAVNGTLKKTLPETATQAASSIENGILAKLKTLELVATNPKLSDDLVPIPEKLAMLDVEKKRSGHNNLTFIDASGNATTTSNAKFNTKDEPSFIKAMNGVSSITDPFTDKATGKPIVVYYAPIMKNGKAVGAITAARDGNEICT